MVRKLDYATSNCKVKFIPGNNKAQLQLMRCMNRLSRLGGKLLWFSDRKAYMDNLYICANNKLFVRYGFQT